MKYDDEATLALLDAMERLTRLTEHGKKFGHSPEEIYNTVSVLHSISSALEDGANPNPIENVSLVGELCRCPLDGRVELSQTIKLAVAFGADPSISDLTIYTSHKQAHPLRGGKIMVKANNIIVGFMLLLCHEYDARKYIHT